MDERGGGRRRGGGGGRRGEGGDQGGGGLSREASAILRAVVRTRVDFTRQAPKLRRALADAVHARAAPRAWEPLDWCGSSPEDAEGGRDGRGAGRQGARRLGNHGPLTRGPGPLGLADTLGKGIRQRSELHELRASRRATRTLHWHASATRRVGVRPTAARARRHLAGVSCVSRQTVARSLDACAATIGLAASTTAELLTTRRPRPALVADTRRRGRIRDTHVLVEGLT